MSILYSDNSTLAPVREAESYRVEWDGRDDANQPVGGGVYFYRLSGVKDAERRTMVLLR